MPTFAPSYKLGQVITLTAGAAAASCSAAQVLTAPTQIDQRISWCWRHRITTTAQQQQQQQQRHMHQHIHTSVAEITRSRTSPAWIFISLSLSRVNSHSVLLLLLWFKTSALHCFHWLRINSRTRCEYGVTSETHSMFVSLVFMLAKHLLLSLSLNASVFLAEFSRGSSSNSSSSTRQCACSTAIIATTLYCLFVHQFSRHSFSFQSVFLVTKTFKCCLAMQLCVCCFHNSKTICVVLCCCCCQYEK